ncbi:hypothetical protein ACH50P_21980, partial [Sulfitobacter sp. M22386]
VDQVRQDRCVADIASSDASGPDLLHFPDRLKMDLTPDAPFCAVFDKRAPRVFPLRLGPALYNCRKWFV